MQYFGSVRLNAPHPIARIELAPQQASSVPQHSLSWRCSCLCEDDAELPSGAMGTISRRRSLSAMAGLLVLGSGLSVVLHPASARAGDPSKFVLRIHKHAGGKKKLVGTLELTDELLTKLAASGDAPIEIAVERGSGSDKKVLGQATVAGAANVKQAIKKARAAK